MSPIPFKDASVQALKDTVERLRSFRGSLMVGGGGRDPLGLIRPRFVARCGGDASRIAIIPTASYVEQTGDIYCDIFRQLGVGNVWIVHPQNGQANDNEVFHALRPATGIVLTGGDQKQLVSVLGGTLTIDTIIDRLRAGVGLFTTSAGTVALGDIMVAGLDEQGHLLTRKGLSILPGTTIEVHVSPRNRHWRLEELCRRHINPLIIGLDEDTAMEFIPWTSRARIVGPGTAHFLFFDGQWHHRTLHDGGSFDLADFVV